METELLTTGDVARRLGVSTTWVLELGNQGILPYSNTRLGRLYEPEEVARLAAQRELKEDRVAV